MIDKLLKIVFIEKSETTELKSLNNVFGEITTYYKFVKDDLGISELISNLENEENLVCRYIDGVLYVEGLRKKLADNYVANLHSIVEEMKQLDIKSMEDLFGVTETISNTNEKDIIDKLAEKYRKEAEDKNKLN